MSGLWMNIIAFGVMVVIALLVVLLFRKSQNVWLMVSCTLLTMLSTMFLVPFITALFSGDFTITINFNHFGEYWLEFPLFIGVFGFSLFAMYKGVKTEVRK